MDPEGNEHRRHYQIETLTNALSKQIRTNDRFVQPSIRQVLGNVQIKSIDLELAEESKYRLVFRVKVSAMNRAQATFGLVAWIAFGQGADGAHGNLFGIGQG